MIATGDNFKTVVSSFSLLSHSMNSVSSVCACSNHFNCAPIPLFRLHGQFPALEEAFCTGESGT